MTAGFMKEWAMKAWELEQLFIGDLSGGIEGIKNLVDCFVAGRDEVIIKYRLPATCGLSDVIYHNSNPEKIWTDIFRFSEDGTILMNGKPFPGEYETEPWTKEEAEAFRKAYQVSLKAL